MGERAIAASPAQIVADGLAPQVSDVPTYLPNAYMQHGAACTAKPGGTGCFLEVEQRDILIRQVENRVTDAGGAYLRAIGSTQVELLLEADDDLPWLAMLLLDVATAGIATAASIGLKHLVQGGAGKLAKMAFDAGIHANSPSFPAVVLRAVQGLTEKQFAQGAKMALEPLKKGVGAEVKEALALARTVKTDTSAELTALKAQVNNGFQKYRETIPGVATDAELLTLFHSFDAAIQSELLYMSLLSEKMNRFRKSGVTKIGRMPAGRDERLRKTPELENEMGTEVLRDTRVVWVQYSEGGPRELRYEQHDGERVHSILHPGGEHHPRKGLPTFGPANPLTDESELGRPVPTEFQAAALSRHQQVWGVDPETIRVRAPYWGFFEKGIEEFNHRKPAPTKDKPAPAPADPSNGPFVDALPLGMPLAQSKKQTP